MYPEYITYMEVFTFLNSAEQKLLFVAKKLATVKQLILGKFEPSACISTFHYGKTKKKIIQKYD